MRVVIIGGSGHVGTYLVPRLVEAGCTVINVSRGQNQPYQPHPAWQQVRQVTLDRSAAEIREALRRDPGSRLLLQRLRDTYTRRLALSRRALYA